MTYSQPPGTPGTPCREDCTIIGPVQAHCTVCHQTFTGTPTFDRHRRDGGCLNPADLGLTKVRHLWATPEGHAKRAHMADVRPNRPSPHPDT